jgi:hypothetical protein
MAAVDGAIGMGVADPERLGVGGWSYGGILTNHIIAKTARFKAAISGASEFNYFANYGTDHYQQQWEAELGLPWQNPQLWMRLSPFFRVDRITTPTLVMGGEMDVNVPIPCHLSQRDAHHPPPSLPGGPARALPRLVRQVPEAEEDGVTRGLTGRGWPRRRTLLHDGRGARARAALSAGCRRPNAAAALGADEGRALPS